MHLAQLNITNFRKLHNVKLHFQPGLNVLVGANNVGKTAVSMPCGRYSQRTTNRIHG